MKKIILNTVSNKITVARMFLGGFPPAIIIYYLNNRFEWMIFCFFWVIIWEISDIIDGKLARHNGEVSEIGKLLDPLADIKMHVPLFIVLTWLNETCPLWAILIIVMRELSITGGRAVIATLKNGEATSSRKIGKIKTWIYALSILYSIIFIVLNTPNAPIFLQIPKVTVHCFFYLAATVSLYTWIEYGWHFWQKIGPLIKRGGPAS